MLLLLDLCCLTFIGLVSMALTLDAKTPLNSFDPPLERLSLIWPFLASRAACLCTSSSRNFASISLLGGYFGKLEASQANGFVVKSSLSKALAAVPLCAGSIESNVSISPTAVGGRSLNASVIRRL
nr:hypothetical protein Iba_chr03bCG14860 [Ipomoea batatas]